MLHDKKGLKCQVEASAEMIYRSDSSNLTLLLTQKRPEIREKSRSRSYEANNSPSWERQHPWGITGYAGVGCTERREGFLTLLCPSRHSKALVCFLMAIGKKKKHIRTIQTIQIFSVFF